MKKTMRTIRAKLTGKSKQEQLLDFVSNQENISKAVEGSMRKRVELLDRVELKEKHA